MLIKAKDQWNVVIYIWNAEQNEAFLELSGKDIQVNWIDITGNMQRIPYQIPDEEACVSCHQSNSKVMPLGPTMRNLNDDRMIHVQPINQLQYLQSLGLLNDFDRQLIDKIPDYKAISNSLEERARAYLDMNCAHCHQPSAGSRSARTGFDFRFETAIENSQLLDQQQRVVKALESGEMPYLGVSVVDDEGMNIILDYLDSL